MTERHVHQWDQCSACGALRAHVPPEVWYPIATAPTQTPVLLTDGTGAVALSLWASGWRPHPPFTPTAWRPVPA